VLAGVEGSLVDRTVSQLTPLGDVSGVVADVGREGDVDRLVETAGNRLGGIDVLINNAGVAWREPFLDITPDSWDRMLNVNLRGMFLVAHAVARQLVDQGRGGVIVNMSSTNGLGGEAGFAHYNASKAGVLLLTKTMAVELGQYGVRVNAVCPGYIDTPLNSAVVAAMGDDDFAAGYARDNIPLRRSPPCTRSSPPTTHRSSTAPRSWWTVASSRSCEDHSADVPTSHNRRENDASTGVHRPRSDGAP
jgi:NAD(P)-dependent dehydrogenase (short-subunit alcohol dehydrogenase family)